VLRDGVFAYTVEVLTKYLAFAFSTRTDANADLSFLRHSVNLVRILSMSILPNSTSAVLVVFFPTNNFVSRSARRDLGL
jgi:hypothetical protein